MIIMVLQELVRHLQLGMIITNRQIRGKVPLVFNSLLTILVLDRIIMCGVSRILALQMKVDGLARQMDLLPKLNHQMIVGTKAMNEE